MGSPLIQSVLRALDLLEAVSASESGLTLAELSDDLGLKTPTAFNLAKTLVARGYLEKTARPIRYRLGPSLAPMAQRQRRHYWLETAEDAVRRLFAMVEDATVLVAENTHGDFIPRLRLDPLRPAVLEHVVNRHLSPYSAAVALCFQAFWSEQERAVFRDRYPFCEYGQGAWSSLEELEHYLASARQRGYVLVQRGGPVRAAAPIYAPDGTLLGSIGASLAQHGEPLSQETVEHLVTAVCRISDDVS